jgi:colanic acid biosynthesis glycosyl transferase WcaI
LAKAPRLSVEAKPIGLDQECLHGLKLHSMKNNRIWIVSEVYYPEETGTGYFITKIAERLAAEFSVKALCGQPGYASRGVRAPSRELHNGVDIIRCPATTLNKDVFIQRIINLVTISLSIFWMAVRSIKKGDLVVVVTNPPLLPYTTMLACRLRGARYIVRVDDVYPDMLVVAKLLSRQSALFRGVNWFTAQLYHGAERVIVLGQDMSRLAVGKMSRHGDRVQVIPTWADLDLVSPASKADNALLQELGLTRKFVVQWAGNMGHPHDVESLWEAMVRLQDDPEIHFLFVGSGYKRAWLASQVQSAGLRNVTLLGNRPRSDQQNFLNACDVSLSSYVKGMTGLGVPSRTYNILAAGKPILAIGEPDSELGCLINQEKVGWLVPPGDPDQLVQVIAWARNNPGQVAEMGQRGRRLVEAKYSSELIINQYLEMIRHVEESN